MAASPDQILQIYNAGQGQARIDIYVKVEGETGDLLLLSQLAGPVEAPWWGESDYESRLKVRSVHKDAVLRLLLAENGRPASEIAKCLAWDRQSRDLALLDLLAARYRGNDNALALFQDWCEARQIHVARDNLPFWQ